LKEDIALRGVPGRIVTPVTARELAFALVVSAGFTLVMDAPEYWVFRRYRL
jgi:hypothetical protein